MSDEPKADTRRTPRRVLAMVSANLLEARENAGLTQEELAERSEVDLPEIEQIERGVALPNLDTVAMLAGALGVAPADLAAGVVWDVERQRFE
jgi:transcriptional regulator with XRE-family HTH domain